MSGQSGESILVHLCLVLISINIRTGFALVTQLGYETMGQLQVREGSKVRTQRSEFQSNSAG